MENYSYYTVKLKKREQEVTECTLLLKPYKNRQNGTEINEQGKIIHCV